MPGSCSDLVTCCIVFFYQNRLIWVECVAKSSCFLTNYWQNGGWRLLSRPFKVLLYLPSPISRLYDRWPGREINQMNTVSSFDEYECAQKSQTKKLIHQGTSFFRKSDRFFLVQASSQFGTSPEEGTNRQMYVQTPASHILSHDRPPPLLN